MIALVYMDFSRCIAVVLMSFFGPRRVAASRASIAVGIVDFDSHFGNQILRHFAIDLAQPARTIRLYTANETRFESSPNNIPNPIEIRVLFGQEFYIMASHFIQFFVHESSQKFRLHWRAAFFY